MTESDREDQQKNDKRSSILLISTSEIGEEDKSVGEGKGVKYLFEGNEIDWTPPESSY